MAKPEKRRGKKGARRAARPAAKRAAKPSAKPVRPPAPKTGAPQARRAGASSAGRHRRAAPQPALPPVPPVPPPPAPAPPDLEPADPPRLGDVPWGYGQDRVTALARDPHWIFVYWELTDEAIERARAEAGAPDAACVLRVYDTTWRLFDGTNANWYVDVPVQRPANNHYVCVNRPASVFHVDIGVKSREGWFAKIARSAPVETPRDSISPDAGVEWMTVTYDGTVPPEYRHRVVEARPAPASAPPAGDGLDLERVMHALVGEGWSRAEWEEGEDGGRVVRWVRWTGPFWREHWRTVAGERVEIVFEGERRVLQGAWGERVVFGPWRVAIHAVGPGGAQRLIDRWTIHYAWPTAGGLVRVETEQILARIVRGYRAAALGGASEARILAEAWGSEALQAGASEWQWLRGSEARLGGASELRWGGASEWLWPGASEFRWGGASEWLWPGASASWLGGASEWRSPGASEGFAR
ncbi:MAG: DUF4912 domain-containing protein [Candidatus Rokubacteria bacterium]|nr:DUF4912 domain-containing protein [Candidatus Rokubacteria bacterium]